MADDQQQYSRQLGQHTQTHTHTSAHPQTVERIILYGHGHMRMGMHVRYLCRPLVWREIIS